MKNNESWIGRLLLLLFGAALLVLLIGRMHLFSGVRDWFRSKPVLIDNTPLVIKEIKSIAELNTVVMYQELVIDSTATVPAAIPAIINPFTFNVTPLVSQKQIVLIVKGRVKAGLNLGNLSGERVFVKDDSVNIVIPRATITDVFINPSDIETFYENGKWTNQEVTIVKQSARRKLLAEASRQGLLGRAEARARSVITQFLRTAGFKKIEITVAKA